MVAYTVALNDESPVWHLSWAHIQRSTRSIKPVPPSKIMYLGHK